MITEPSSFFNVQLQNILQTTENNSLIVQSDLAKFADTVNKQFEDRFSDLGNYFRNLASFDQNKADADISFIEGRLQSFTKDTANDEEILTTQTEALMIGMLTVETTDLASDIVKATAVISQSVNPLDPSPGDILESYQLVAQAVTSLASAGVTAVEFKDFVESKKNIAEKFNLNYEFLNNSRRIVAGFKGGSNEIDFQNKTEWFLNEYTAYDPKVQRQDLVVYQTNWEAFVDEACERIFGAHLVPSHVVKSVFIDHDSCRKSKNLVQRLMTTYADMYEYQFDFIETLAQAVRARNAKRYAEGLSSSYNDQEDTENSEKKYLCTGSQPSVFT